MFDPILSTALTGLENAERVNLKMVNSKLTRRCYPLTRQRPWSRWFVCERRTLSNWLALIDNTGTKSDGLRDKDKLGSRYIKGKGACLRA